MPRFYHGTSADNLYSILKNGLVPNKDKLWSVSEDYVYAYHPKQLAKNFEREDIDECAFQNTVEQAMYSLAKAKKCRAVIIQFEWNGPFSFDNSCGITLNQAVQIKCRIHPKWFRSVKLSNDVSMYKGYFLALVKNHSMTNIYPNNLEKQLAEAMSNSHFECEDIFTEWRELLNKKDKQ